MEDDEKIALHVLIRFFWKKGLSVRKTVTEINSVEGENATSKSTVGYWFKRFANGDVSLQDKPRLGRPSVVNDEDLCAKLEEKPHSSTRDLQTEIDGSKSATMDYILKSKICC